MAQHLLCHNHSCRIGRSEFPHQMMIISLLSEFCKVCGSSFSIPAEVLGAQLHAYVKVHNLRCYSKPNSLHYGYMRLRRFPW